MENDYLQKINLDLLHRDLGMTLEQIAEPRTRPFSVSKELNARNPTTRNFASV